MGEGWKIKKSKTKHGLEIDELLRCGEGVIDN